MATTTWLRTLGLNSGGVLCASLLWMACEPSHEGPQAVGAQQPATTPTGLPGAGTSSTPDAGTSIVGASGGGGGGAPVSAPGASTNLDAAAPSARADGGVTPATSAPSGAVTYQKDIRAIMERSCLDCHTKGGIGPIPFDDWSTIKPVTGVIADAVASGIMPPSGWNEGCHKLNEERSLTAEQKALFAKWKQDGFLEGNAADYVAPPPRTKKVLGDPSVVMSMATAYTPPANADEYRCFLLDPIQSDLYITGMQIIPGQTAEVHHVIIHRVDSAQLSQVKALDQADAKPGYVCNGGAGVTAQNMFSYRPGSEAVTFGKGDAVFMAGGSSLVIQVHYNTVFLGQGKSPTPDQTKIALWTLPSGQLPDHVVYRTTTFGPINIPANADHVVSNISQPMSTLATVGGVGFGIGGTFVPGEIIGMTPHAHQLAKVMNASLKRADGSSACLDDVKWDFQWQLDYLFDTGVPYSQGDTFVASCTYDNSAANQPVINGVKQTSKAVVFGERSTDEMCEHYIWLRFERDAFMRAR